jgi:hypothetical protein
MKRVILIIITVLILATIWGCTPMKQVTSIWEPKTETGRILKKEYINELQNMVTDVGKINGINEILGVFQRGFGDDSTLFYFGVHVSINIKYNTLRTNFEDRTATAVAENGFPILQAISKQQKPVNDSLITGVFLSIAWVAADFTKIYSSSSKEAVYIYITKQLLNEYLSFKVTNQELLNKSITVGYKNGRIIGRIQLNVNKNI